MLWPKKNSYQEFYNEKKFLRLKNSPPPPITFLMVCPLIAQTVGVIFHNCNISPKNYFANFIDKLDAESMELFLLEDLNCNFPGSASEDSSNLNSNTEKILQNFVENYSELSGPFRIPSSVMTFAVIRSLVGETAMKMVALVTVHFRSPSMNGVLIYGAIFQPLGIKTRLRITANVITDSGIRMDFENYA